MNRRDSTYADINVSVKFLIRGPGVLTSNASSYVSVVVSFVLHTRNLRQNDVNFISLAKASHRQHLRINMTDITKYSEKDVMVPTRFKLPT